MILWKLEVFEDGGFILLFYVFLYGINFVYVVRFIGINVFYVIEFFYYQFDI